MRKCCTKSQLLGGSTEDLIVEAGKCHLVCANCHRQRTQTGKRPNNVDHSGWLAKELLRLSTSIPFPADKRCKSNQRAA